MRRGQRIADRFEILEHAGAGGMGTVYRALDTGTGRSVAVKLLTLDEEASAERFAREASVLAQLAHPGIVGYVSHGTHEGKHYLVMEWVSGETLNRVLDREGLTVAETLVTIGAIAEALQELHKHGLVHRDIKPSNLIFPERSAARRVKVLDFGLARRAEELTGPTRTGLMVGSPGYMSPEQARGKREVSPEADIFSLGCVFYECLTGSAAFEGPDPLTIRSKVLMVEPRAANVANPNVTAEIAALAHRMMAKDAGSRPRNGAEVAAIIHQLEVPESPHKQRRSRARPEQSTAVLPGEEKKQKIPLEGLAGTMSEELPLSHDSGPVTAQFVILVGAEGDTTAPPDAVRSAVLSQGGTVEVLESGQMVAVLSGTSDPAEEAAKAARIALSMRATLPDVPMTLVSDCSTTPNLGGLIERGVQAMHLESMESLFAGVLSDDAAIGGIRIDPQALRLLGPRFRFQRKPTAAYLVGEVSETATNNP